MDSAQSNTACNGEQETGGHLTAEHMHSRGQAGSEPGSEPAPVSTFVVPKLSEVIAWPWKCTPKHTAKSCPFNFSSGHSVAKHSPCHGVSGTLASTQCRSSGSVTGYVPESRAGESLSIAP